MFSVILISTSSLISVLGTIYAVLSILKLTISDVYSSITTKGMDNRDEELLVQREQARIGIPLVMLGWVGQTVFSVIKICSYEHFFACLLVYIALACIVMKIIRIQNTKFRTEYEQKKVVSKDYQNTHKTDHKWGTF